MLDNMRRVCEWNKLQCKLFTNNVLCWLLEYCVTFSAWCPYEYPFMDLSFVFQVLGLTWGVWDASTFGLHPKIVLGDDVLHDVRCKNADNFLYILLFLFANLLTWAETLMELVLVSLRWPLCYCGISAPK